MSEKTLSDSGLPVGSIVAYLAFFALLIVLQTFLLDALSEKDFDALNLLVPLLFGGANLLLAWRIVRRSPLTIWNPLVWFLLACTLYYGLGQLVQLLGHPDSVARVNTLYFVDPSGLARTNFLHTVGVMIIVGAYLLTATLLKQRKRTAMPDVGSPAQEQRGVREARVATLLFLCIGLPVKYLLQLPADLGLLTWVLPGSIKYLGMLSGVAIIPLYWLYKKLGGVYRVLFFALVISESLANLVNLSKQRMIETVLLVVLADQMVKPGFKKLAISGLLVVVAFVLVVNPFVTFARVAINRSAATDLSQAVDLVEQFQKIEGAVQDVQFPKAQLWWTRLAYSNVELFAMRQYDRGHPGTTLWLAPYALIPRFILTDKPSLSPGLQFTYLITEDANSMSNTGLGVLGEGYWNGGWLGVAVVGVVVGVLLAAFYHFSIRTIEDRIFMFLPMSMAGLMLGYRIDDWFVATYLGTTVQLVLMYLAIQYLVRPMLAGNSGTTKAAVQDDVIVPEKAPRKYPLL